MIVTFRSLNATVRSMQATGQIPEKTADAVIDIGHNLNFYNWIVVRELLVEQGHTEIVEQIENDAAVSNPISKVEVL